MATNAVYNYLKIQNRPYSVNDVVSNLENKFGKSVVQKAIDELTAAGKVFEKVYGKQKVYCITQDTKHEIEELMRIDKELQSHANEVERKYQDIEKEIKVQENVLSSLKSSITLKEAANEVDILKQSITELTNKLDELMETSSTEDVGESKRKAEAVLADYSRAYSQRKRICMEIVNCILENYPGTKNDLYEEIGMEIKLVE